MTPDNPAKSVMERIDPLLALYSPSVVVLKKVGYASKMKKRRSVILAVKRKLAKRFIDVHMVERADVRQRFRESGNRTKYQIASTIAQMFPELRLKLPPKRRPWQTEHYNIAIFDAISLALAYRSQCRVPADSPAENDS